MSMLGCQAIHGFPHIPEKILKQAYVDELGIDMPDSKAHASIAGAKFKDTLLVGLLHHLVPDCTESKAILALRTVWDPVSVRV